MANYSELSTVLISWGLLALVVVVAVPVLIIFFVVKMTEPSAFISALGTTFLRLLASVLICIMSIGSGAVIILFNIFGPNQLIFPFVGGLEVLTLLAWSLLPLFQILRLRSKENL